MAEDKSGSQDELEPAGSSEPAVEDDEDEFDEDDEFDPQLIETARTVGLNPDDFDNANDLYRETELRVAKMETTRNAPAGTEPEELKLAAIEVAFKNKDELDPSYVTALEKLAADTGQNFEALAKRLQAGTGGDKELRDGLKKLNQHVTLLGAQNVQLRLDRWVDRHADVQSYLGKGDTGELDPSDKFSRRRRVLTRRAHTLAARQRGDFTMEQMFVRAFKKMQGKGGEPKKAAGSSKTEPTRAARASGTTAADAGDNSPEAANREAVDVVAKYRRNAK